MTPMYVMILLLAGALMILLNWTYYLTFGRVVGLIPLKPSATSTVIQICDKHLHQRKLVQAWRKVYMLLSLFLVVQSLMMLNCAILGDVYTQAQCVENSLLSTLLQKATWFTVTLHILFLLITDLLPAGAFLFVYLPRVQSVIQGHIEQSARRFKRKNSLTNANVTVVAGNELLTRYTVRVRETITRRNSSRKESRIRPTGFDMLHAGSSGV